MPDNLFDNFVNGKLNDHEAPVPGGVWDKITDRQFDEFIGSKLQGHEAPVPEGVWEKIADGQLDNFFGSSLGNYSATVPDGLWGRVSDGQIDHFFADKLDNYIAPVPAGAWAGVADTQLDHFFADKLSNYSAPVPGGLWEKIHPEEDDDRKIVYWWRLPVAASLLLAVLIGGAMGAYFLFRPHAGNLVKTSLPTTTTVQQSNKGHLQATPVKPADNPNSSTAVTPDQATNPATAPAAAQQEATAKDRRADLPTVHGSTVDQKEKISAPLIRTDISRDHKNSLLTNSNKPGVNKSGLLNNEGHQTPFVPLQNNGNGLAQNGLPPVTGAADENVDYTIALPAYQSSFVPDNTIPTVFGHHSKWDLSGMELKDNKHASKFKSNVICPTNRSGNSDWLLEVYASPDVAFRSLSGGTASTSYLQKKDSSSNMQIGFTAGMRIVKPITDNILLKAGVQYTQMNEKYVYRTENEIKTTTVVTVHTIIRAPGDTVVVSDTSSLQTVGFKNNTIKNRYRSIDIPVTIGYQFGNEDLKIGINAGVIFNMTSWYQGVILDTALAVVPLTKSNNMVYKSKLGLGLYAGINISKQLSEGLQIFCEPYFRYNLSNMTTPQAGYNQKFSLGGLSVGLRFNLNRQ